MTLLSDREAQAVTTRRDAQQAGNFEVRMTDVAAWKRALDADMYHGAVEDGIVWFSVTTLPATLDQVEGKPVPGGHHEARYFGARFVEANYLARGQMQKLSVYCGVSWIQEAPNEIARQHVAPKVQACAEAVQEAVRAVSVVLSRYPQLDVRSGASLHLHNLDEPWVAGPGTRIEAPPEVQCGVCGVAIYWANDAWRDEQGKAEEWRDNGLDHMRRPKKRLDHVHGPTEARL